MSRCESETGWCARRGADRSPLRSATLSGIASPGMKRPSANMIRRQTDYHITMMRLHLETTAKLLISLEHILSLFSKCALKSLNNQTDFDSAIQMCDPCYPGKTESAECIM
jgi:hypothetical protein